MLREDEGQQHYFQPWVQAGGSAFRQAWRPGNLGQAVAGSEAMRQSAEAPALVAP